MCFHCGDAWVKSHGNSAAKGNCVEVYQVAHYFDWRVQQPFMILHELSHAFHWMLSEKLDKHIEAAYKNALASGKYESVLLIASG